MEFEMEEQFPMSLEDWHHFFTSGESPLPVYESIGTAFQHTVWRELQQIPAGTTLSYSQLASRIGRPSAVRAVASACAANHVALFVPCHRVLRSSGGLGGYAWGLEMKSRILELERRSLAAGLLESDLPTPARLAA
jgi:O-6-methylguanine DNA methyltransferase